MTMKKQVYEATAALCGNSLSLRRKSLIPSILTIVMGIVLVYVNTRLTGVEYTNLKSIIVFAAGVMLVAGIIILAVRLFGHSSHPYYNGSKRLYYEELFFERKYESQVIDAAARGDMKTLMSLPQHTSPILTVAAFHTADYSFAACQPFEYVDLEYRPIASVGLQR